MTVIVGYEHMEQVPAKQRCLSCPVATALFKATLVSWIVSPTEAIPLKGTIREAVPLPANASQAIRLWDRTGRMEPFEFDFPWSREGGMNSAVPVE